MEHRHEIIRDKLQYIYDHEGNGAVVHEVGGLLGRINGYQILIDKETLNPIMGEEKMAHYKSQLDKYIREAEEFLVSIANGKSHEILAT